MDPPEELFTKFLSLTGSLSDCTRRWPIQLCSTYYAAMLSTLLGRTVSDDNYTSPSLVGPDSKEDQIEAIYVVRDGANSLYKELNHKDIPNPNPNPEFLYGNMRGGDNDDRNEFRGKDIPGNTNQDNGNNHRDGNYNRDAHQSQIQPSLAEGVLQAHK